MTYGLGSAGYDVRVGFVKDVARMYIRPGEFTLAVTLERFHMPINVLGVVHDKSTWARRGVAVQNTVLEPGWCGYLTLELTNHGPDTACLERGDPIAQIIFHKVVGPGPCYDGKYQDQGPYPTPALSEPPGTLEEPRG
jgi:dCTP deaminase